MDTTVRNKLEKINISDKIMENVSMKDFTTFKTGGKADFFITPENIDELIQILNFVKDNSYPFFILGGGANIVVSDRGIRGIVINLQELKKYSFNGDLCTAEPGIPVSSLSEYAVDRGLGGLDFIYGMPGTVGGAVWMNARCYDVSVSDILTEVKYINQSLEIKTISREYIKNHFFYKKTPFQNSEDIIISATFKLVKENKNKIREQMNRNKKDRENKGHYKFPSAGSVFMNNRSFGKPTGKIIDSLGLKGFSIGGAQIADFHGNIIVNSNNAESSDIKKLVDYIRKTVFDKLGFILEPEIQFVGDWETGEKI